MTVCLQERLGKALHLFFFGGQKPSSFVQTYSDGSRVPATKGRQIQSFIDSHHKHLKHPRIFSRHRMGAHDSTHCFTHRRHRNACYMTGSLSILDCTFDNVVRRS